MSTRSTRSSRRAPSSAAGSVTPRDEPMEEPDAMSMASSVRSRRTPGSQQLVGAASEVSAGGDPGSVANSAVDRLDDEMESESRATQSDLFGSPVRLPSMGSSSRVIAAEGDSQAATSAPRYRADLTTDGRHVRLIDEEVVGETVGGVIPGDSTSEVATADGKRIIIWGTKVCIGSVRREFRKFVETYHHTALDEDELNEHVVTGRLEHSEGPYYMTKIQTMADMESEYLDINLQHVKTFSEHLYRQIVTYPAEIIPYMDQVVGEVLTKFVLDNAETEGYENLVDQDTQNVPLAAKVQCRPYNALKTRNMRSLNPEDIDQLITVSGLVIRVSPIIPEIHAGYFQCSVCSNSELKEVDRGRIEEPTLCTNCNTNHSFSLVHNRSLFSDKQVIKLQEAPEDMPAGQTPHTVTLFAHGDLVDTVNAGDRVTVTSIYRAVPIRLNPRQRTVKAVYRTYLDVLHFRKIDMHRLHDAEDGSRFTQERIDEILEWAQKPDIYDRIARSLAPSIFGHDDIKKGIVCLLFGGTQKDFTEAGRGKWRSDINVLLCGDPGTAKSQLLSYVHDLVPRGQYTSGKGSSAVGLTAYLTKDPDSKQLVLQTGALVLSDNGICCIDEFDKMSDTTRAILHEVMEQQTLSIAKAGIICQLNARTSILAAANPVDSEWNRNKTIIENVQLPHTLLSRFDLIFLLLDPQDEQYDRRLAKHIVSLYHHAEELPDDIMPKSLLRDYIQYSKEHIKPELSEEAGQNLIEKYVAMRKVGSARGQISAYPRQLESLIRLAEAMAKVRLSQTVEVSDIEEAYRLHREALRQSAVDPVTGLIDVAMLQGGMSSSIRKQVLEVASVITEKLGSVPAGMAPKALLADLRNNSDKMITREIFDESLNELRRQDKITRDNANRVKLLYREQPAVAMDDGLVGGL